MNYFGWKKVKEEITLKSILDKTYVQFAPKSINMDFNIESLYKDPEQFSKMEISIRHIDERIVKKEDYRGELFVESGENLIALCMLYMSLHHSGTDYTFAEDMPVGSDGYAYTKKLSKEQEDKYKKWASKLESKIESLVDSDLVDNIDELCEKYANMKVIADVCEIVYIGPTKTIKYSEDMTIGEFSDMIKNQFGVIPVFLHKGEYKKFPLSTRLGEIGVSGEHTLDVKIKTYVGSLGEDMQKQNDLSAYITYKYVKRPWAFVGDSTFDQVDVLPGLFKSIGFALLIRFSYKYFDKI